MTDSDVIRYLLAIISGSWGLLLVIVGFGAKMLIAKIGGLTSTVQTEMRAFDVRLTQVETILKIRKIDSRRIGEEVGE